MLNFINKILSDNGYSQVDIELPLEMAWFYLFCSSESSRREEYFVTIQLSQQSNEEAKSLLEEKAQELFERISNSGKVDPSFEKNCTMLICQEEDKIDRQTILELEEDQYNFKKNVIAYTQQELAAIQAYLTQEKIEKITSSVINRIINADGGKNFLQFKDNHKKQEDHYSLILKIVLKLPFITYSPQEQKLVNLVSEIDSCLSPEQSLVFEQLLSSDVEWNEDNIHQEVESIWGGLV